MRRVSVITTVILGIVKRTMRNTEVEVSRIERVRRKEGRKVEKKEVRKSKETKDIVGERLFVPT